jgi:hypothetical protein
MARYVNDGVLVLDPDRIRADGRDTTMAGIEATARYTSRDQDYMNVNLRDRIHPIDPTWNSGWGSPRTFERFVPKKIHERFRASRDGPGFPDFTAFEKPRQAARSPLQIHLLAKPYGRPSRARWWVEFHAARNCAEAVLGRRLWPSSPRCHLSPRWLPRSQAARRLPRFFASEPNRPSFWRSGRPGRAGQRRPSTISVTAHSTSHRRRCPACLPPPIGWRRREALSTSRSRPVPARHSAWSSP